MIAQLLTLILFITQYLTGYTAQFTITGYATGEPGVGHYTYTGHRVHRGTIAVDPHVIPLGSKIWVPNYGWGIADDIGSQVKGRHVDLYLSSRSDASRFGLRHMRIWVIPAHKKVKHYK